MEVDTQDEELYNIPYLYAAAYNFNPIEMIQNKQTTVIEDDPTRRTYNKTSLNIGER